jgi:Na+/H+ antiporter NhaD/arsenite permease-like protein
MKAAMHRWTLSKAKRKALARLLLLVLLGLGVVLVLSREPSLVPAHAQDLDDSERVGLTGSVIDPQGEPVHDAEVRLLLNGELLADEEEKHGGPGVALSQPDGNFVVDLSHDSIGAIETLALTISRPHFESLDWEASAEEVTRVNQGESLRLPDIELPRRVSMGFWVASITFLVILVLIALEKLHNTMAVLLGVAVILGVTFVGGAVNPDLFIFDFDRALEYVNFDVIFLVLGMMIVIAVIEETGVFQWLAYQSYRLSGGRAWLLVVILIGITAVASAMLDNVTTMLLMTPITIQIALAMQMNPLALLMPEVLASNVGGISTLIGTPTNILIGAYAGLGFNDFVINLTPGVIAALVALTAYILLRYRKQLLGQRSGLSDTLLERLRKSARIEHPYKLRVSGLIFFIMLIAFVFGESIHLVPAVTALLGAVAMLLWVAPDVEDMIKIVDWTTLMFFIALFMLVGAIQEVGLISLIAQSISDLVGDNLTVAILLVVWSAALLSGIIANIPFTAAMLPVVRYLTITIPGASNNVLFYALSIGSAMGGNSTLIGASANLVTAGISERAGYRISFMQFSRIGAPSVIITVIIGTLWLFIRF